MEQQFECGDHLECIEVRQDAQGRYYSQLNDIQDAFPGAARFRVEGKGILFLEDDNGQRYKTKTHKQERTQEQDEESILGD